MRGIGVDSNENILGIATRVQTLEEWEYYRNPDLIL